MNNQFLTYNRLLLSVFIISMFLVTTTGNGLIFRDDNQSTNVFDDFSDNNSLDIPRDNSLTDEISMTNFRESDTIVGFNPSQSFMPVGIITTHAESMSYSYLQIYYEGMGYTVDIITQTLTDSLLSQYGYLFVGEHGYPWLASEVTAVENFIAAGGVFVGIGDSEASYGVIQIGLNNGIAFLGNNLDTGGITTNINAGHLFMDDVTSLYIPSIFNSLQLTGSAVEMFRGSSNVDIIGATVDIGSGTFCVLCDDFAGYIYNEDNEIMFANFLQWSSSPFDVNITSPTSSEKVSGTIDFAWNGSDPSGGDLNYTVLLWDYHNSLWLPLIEETNETSVEFNSTLYLDGLHYRIKIEATNGTHTGNTTSGTFIIDNYEEPPSVTILFPIGGEFFDNYIPIDWVGNDPDLDSLTYTIYYREDTGSWIDLISGLNATDYFWVITSINNGNYYLRIVASDGVLEGENTTLSTFRIQHPNNIPTVTLLQPNDGGIYTGNITISWSGSDVDGDNLTYNLYYWNEANWMVIVLGLSTTSYGWDSRGVPNGDFYQIRVMVSDGMANKFDTTDTTFTIENEGTGRFNIPLTAVTISLAIGLFIILLTRKRKK